MVLGSMGGRVDVHGVGPRWNSIADRAVRKMYTMRSAVQSTVNLFAIYRHQVASDTAIKHVVGSHEGAFMPYSSWRGSVRMTLV